MFHNIENNLRELGFGDVSVNKKMKELNKILYDILLKFDLEKNSNNKFKVNQALIKDYFNSPNVQKNKEFEQIYDYFSVFFNFCFELPLDNMIEEAIKFKY